MSRAKRDPDVQAATSFWRGRGAVVIAAVVLVHVLVLMFAGASSLIALNHLISDGLLIDLWLLSAAGYGSWMLVALRGKDSQAGASLRIVSTIALGIGILSLLQLGLGLAGQLHRAVAWAVILVGIALLAIRCRKIRSEDLSRWANAPADWEWLWLLATPVLAMAIVAALVPPGILWGDEPNGYDVVEYHLQIPREWYEAHHITPLHHNVFSYFPQGMEMHYLLAMQLRHSASAGMYLAQLMHVAVTALSVLAVYAAARQFASKLPAILAALAAAYVPWTLLLAPVAYNEGGLLLFGTLAIAWCLRAVGATPALPFADEGDAGVAPTWQLFAIAGVMAAFACGVKLTAGPQVLVTVPFVFVVMRIGRKESIARVCRDAAVFVLAGALVFSPWLIRNAIWAHNPVFPEAQSILGRAHFSEAQAKRWRDAHSPRPDQHAVGARITEAWRQIGIDWRYGFIILPIGMICALAAIRRPEAWIVLALLAAWLVFWIGFTHLQGRFFVLAIPVAAMAIALLGEQRWQRVTAACLTLAVMISGLTIMGGVFAERVGPFCSSRALGVTDLKDLLPEELVPLITKQESLALVGDAKALLYQLPPGKLHYRTVFDVDVKPGQSVVQAWLEGIEGSPTIVIDPNELERFSRTYYGIPPLSEDFPGPRDRPFIAYPQQPPAR